MKILKVGTANIKLALDLTFRVTGLSLNALVAAQRALKAFSLTIVLSTRPTDPPHALQNYSGKQRVSCQHVNLPLFLH